LTSFYNIDNVSAKIGTWLKGRYIFYDNTSISGSFKTSPKIIKGQWLCLILSKLKYLVKSNRFLDIIRVSYLHKLMYHEPKITI